MDNPELHLLLGEIKGKLELVIEGQESHDKKLDGLGGRLSKAESKAAQHGLITGAIAAIGITFIKEKLGL